MKLAMNKAWFKLSKLQLRSWFSYSVARGQVVIAQMSCRGNNLSMIVVIMTMVSFNLTSYNLSSTLKTIFHTKNNHFHALVHIFTNMHMHIQINIHIHIHIHKHKLYAQLREKQHQNQSSFILDPLTPLPFSHLPSKFS